MTSAATRSRGPSGGSGFEESAVALVSASGAFGREDQFHFLHQPVDGDFTIDLQISELVPTENGRGFAGVILRGSLEESALQAVMVFERSPVIASRLWFRNRRGVGEATRSAAGPFYGKALPWVRLERRGAEVTGFWSPDGKEWYRASGAELGLPDVVEAGVVVGGAFARIRDLNVSEHATTAFLRGDCNGDGRVDLADAVRVVDLLFNDATTSCRAACDTDADMLHTLSDALGLVQFRFGSGDPPRAPYPRCGAIPKADQALGCEATSPGCP